MAVPHARGAARPSPREAAAAILARIGDAELDALADALAALLLSAARSDGRRLRSLDAPAPGPSRRGAGTTNAPPGADIRTARLAGAGRGAHRREND